MFGGKFVSEFACEFESEPGRGEVVGETFSRLRDPRRAKFRLSSDSDFHTLFPPKREEGRTTVTLVKNFIALRASAAVPPLICALEADLGGTGAGGRAVVCGATGNAAGARPR